MSSRSLTKKAAHRPRYEQLLEHPFILKYENAQVDVATWYARLSSHHKDKASATPVTTRREPSRNSPKKFNVSQASSASPKIAPKPCREAAEMFTSPSPSGSRASLTVTSSSGATRNVSNRDASPAPRRKFAESPVPPRRLSRENSPAGPRNFQPFNFGNLLTTFGAGGGSSNGSSDNTPPSPFVRQNSLTRDAPFYRQSSFRSDGGQFLRQNSLTRGETANFQRHTPFRASAGSRAPTASPSSYVPPVTAFGRRNSLSPRDDPGPKFPNNSSPSMQHPPPPAPPGHGHPKSGSCNSLGGPSSAGLPPSGCYSSRDPSPSGRQRAGGGGSNFLETTVTYYPGRNIYYVQRSRESLAATSGGAGAAPAAGPTSGSTSSITEQCGSYASLPPRSGSAEPTSSGPAGIASQYMKKSEYE